MFVHDSKIKEFCRFYKDDAAVRRNLAFETGYYVPLRRIAIVRAGMNRLKSAHLGHETSGAASADNVKAYRDMMEEGSKALLRAIVAEHDYAFKKPCLLARHFPHL